MKKYDAYMPSGIDWIGEIPEEWKLKRGRYIVKLLSGFPADSNLFTDDDSFMPLIRIRDIDNTTTEVFYKGNYPKEYLIQYNDVLVGMDGDFNIAKWKGSNAILNQRVCKIIETDEMLADYAYYLFQTPLKLINDVTYSTTVKHLSTNDIKDFRFPVPPLSEQIAITEYLDTWCTKIDNVIAIQQKRIKMLKELKQSIITKAVTKGLDKNAKMKDSGIEWIGEVPEDWRVMKINYLVNTIADVNHYMPNDVDCGYPYVMTGDLKEYANEIDFENCKQISETDFKELSTKVKAEKGDVIFARYATIGTVCYVDIEKDFIVSYSCVTIKPKYKLLLGKYLYYYLKSQTFFEGISQSVNSNTQGNVGIESLSAEKMVVPSIEEQTAIAAYLDAKCATIDKQISKVERQIELLKEYKQSVITECVTGKRKVC